MTAKSGSFLVERHRRAADLFLPEVELIIGVEARQTGSAGTITHISPTTGLPQARIPLAGPAEIDEAVRAALGPWRAMHPGRRREVLSNFARLVRECSGTEVAVLENGGGAFATDGPGAQPSLPASFGDRPLKSSASAGGVWTRVALAVVSDEASAFGDDVARALAAGAERFSPCGQTERSVRDIPRPAQGADVVDAPFRTGGRWRV